MRSQSYTPYHPMGFRPAGLVPTSSRHAIRQCGVPVRCPLECEKQVRLHPYLAAKRVIERFGAFIVCTCVAALVWREESPR